MLSLTTIQARVRPAEFYGCQDFTVEPVAGDGPGCKQVMYVAQPRVLCRVYGNERMLISFTCLVEDYLENRGGWFCDEVCRESAGLSEKEA
jgi:hypothetical protein